MDENGAVQIAEYEFHSRLDAFVNGPKGGDRRSTSVLVPPPPVRIKGAIRKDVHNLVVNS